MTQPTPQQPVEGSSFAPALTQAFKERLRPCLNALDGLRAIGLQREISLPAIAVVGDQSVGKSSVLEAISGVEFPRGLGIVTRCPLMLSMRGRDDSGWSARIRYQTKAGEQRDKQLNSSAAIGQAIRDAQEEMTSSPGEISEKLIELRIESRDSPDLTLIDLPGIARFSIASGGDIASLTKSLIMSFIERPEVLILIVIPCHVDVETVEAVSLAMEVDPESKRTIGVLTCPDLVNPGSEMEVLAMMRNERLKLLKGFVTVRCRTPQQLKENMGLQEACKAEEDFFRSHSQFRALDEYQRGTKTLANKLSVELFEAVKSRVPEMLREIQAKRDEYNTALKELGSGPPDSEPEMNLLLEQMFSTFKREYESAAKGTHWHEESRLYGPCRKHWEALADAIEECAFSGKSDNKGLMAEIKSEVESQRGRGLPGFDNIIPVLERLVWQHFLVPIKPHTNAFLLSVTQQVETVLRDLADKIFGMYPNLTSLVKEEADAIKSEMVEQTKNHIEEILAQERCVFTQDRIYRNEMDRPTNEMLQMTKPDPSAKDGVPSSARGRAHATADVTTQNSQRILDGAEAYVRVSVRRLQDIIPMAVIHYMLHRLADKICTRFGVLVMDPQSLYPKLEAENPEVGLKRRRLKQALEKLVLAERELAKI